MNFNTKNTFLLINKKIDYALQTSNYHTKDIFDIQIGPLNPNNKRQLWLIQQQQKYSYQIINGFTDQVLTEDGDKLILKRGSASKHQLWKLQYINQTDLRIRRAKASKQFIVIQNGIVKVKQMSANQADLWTIQPVLQSSILSKSCFIIQKQSKKYIDIPESSREQGTQIGVWQPNYRYNQRWKILRAGQIYVIKSHFNQMNLDVEQQKYANGTNIVQWSSHGGVNQFWIFQRIKQDLNQFRICTCFDRQLELGLHHNKLVLHKGRKFIWIVDGYFPE